MRARGFRLSLAGNALLWPVLTAFLTLLALWCQPNRLRDILAGFLDRPVLFPLNALPVGLLLLAAAFLLRGMFRGAAAASLMVGGLSLVNRIKIQVRDEPLFPRDLALWKEAGSAAGNYSMELPAVTVVVILICAAVFALLGVCVRTRPCPVRRLAGWRGSLLGAAASLALLWILIVTLFASDTLYNDLGASNPYRLSVVFNENGFPYNFCHQFTKYLVDRPAGYSRSEAEAWDSAPTDRRTGAPVNVVLVMNEAFSDITDDPAFAFSEETDPLANLHAVQADPHALALRLVVPGFAGGTANTEFDVFTGMQTNALGATTTSAMRTVNRNLDSVFRVFRADGYQTSFTHPGNDWFYNRENVYRWFGAEETVFIDQMAAPVYKGNWVADDDLAGRIETAFDAAAPDGPQFRAATTIQNHMGYPRSKYGEDFPYPEVPLHTEVSDAVRSMLEVYIEGARDADAMLGRLCAFFAAREEPVLLVYYGDHLPYLGDDRLAYAELGMDVAKDDAERENYFCIHETPCVLWANDAAAEALDWAHTVDALGLPENGKLSAAFLGALILDLTGRGEADAWTAFLNTLRRELPVVQGPVWMLADGSVLEDGAPRTASDTAPDAAERNRLTAEIARWRKWSYYKLEQKSLR